MTGFEYGNTRLRAMRSRMLSNDDYGRMAASGSLERLIGVLADSDYREDVEAAITRYGDVRRLDAAVRHHLTRVLQAMRSFYESPVVDRIDILLQRWDARNLVLLLRARSRPGVDAEVLQLLVPVGRIDGAALEALAAQPGPRAIIDLLVAWGLPSKSAARHLLRVWPEYEETGDPVILDRAVMASLGQLVADVFVEEDTSFARVLRAEVDRTNVLSALRLRAARLAGEEDPAAYATEDVFIPGGTIATGRLLDVIEMDESAAVVATLTAKVLLPGWEEALAGWVATGELVALADALDRETARYAAGLLWRGDPLSLDIPLGFVAAKESEARNVRWIGRGVVHGLAPEEIAAGVVVV